MRPYRSKAEEHPGTVRVGGRGLCSTCHTFHHRNGTLDRYTSRPRGRPTLGTAECLTCKRHIRPGSTTLEQWPGTVKSVMGRCQSCHALHSQGTTPERLARTAAALDWYRAWRRPYRLKAGMPC
jgi:hypothetical protein